MLNFENESEFQGRRKPFRARSFSLDSSRKSTNQLLKAAARFTSKSGEQKPNTQKVSFCERFHLSNKKYVKRTFHENRTTFSRGRNLCRYICNFVRFSGVLIILVAFGLHLQYQWQMGNYSVEVIIVSTTGITALTFVVVLYLWFGLIDFSRSIVHFWISLAYGILFLQKTHLRLLNKTIMYCVIISTALRCLCSLVERISKLSLHRRQFLSKVEFSDLLAFSLVCFLLPPVKCLDMVLNTAILGFILMHLRMKSPLCIAIVVLYGVISGVSIVGNLGVKTNKYSLACFIIRMLWDPFLDLYFSNIKPLERWSWFLLSSRILIYPFSMILIVVELIFARLAFQAIAMRPMYELPIMLTFILTSFFLWSAMHVTYLTMHIAFFRKISKCKQLRNAQKYQDKTFFQILSNEGVRRLAGTCYSVTSGCVFATGLLGVVCWRRRDGTYPAIYLMLFTIESLSLTLFTHLATHIRGTCYGYGVVASNAVVSTGDRIGLVLPSNTFEVQTMSASRIMNAIQHFFGNQLIESLGCDCWSRGAKLSLASVETKLRLLFSKCNSSDNQPYDNYVVYFNGSADLNGSWILADGAKFTVERLVKIWNERPGGGSRRHSRLVLIIDSPNSKVWLKSLKKFKSPVVLQCCTYSCDDSKNHRSVSEEGWAKRGDFTLLWTSFLKSLENFSKREQNYKISNFILDLRDQGIEAKYHFTHEYLKSFLSPPGGSFSQHFCTLCCLPVVKFTSFLSTNLFSVASCNLVRRLLRSVKFKVFPNNSYDIGQDFILINS